MSASTIKDALARKKKQSPQYDYMWRVELPDLSGPSTGAATGHMNSIKASIAGGGMEELNHRVSSIDTPFFQMETKKITDKNSFWYSASNYDIGSINMVIDEFEDGLTFDYLVNWLRLIMNPDGTYNPPAAFKHDIKFIRMSATTLDLHVFWYKGFFLSEISNIQNNYEGNDITQYSVVLTGDSIEYIPISPSEVKTKVAQAETSQILKTWANDKFRMDGIKGADQVRMLGDLSKIFT